jgi:hypothetical protein
MTVDSLSADMPLNNQQRLECNSFISGSWTVGLYQGMISELCMCCRQTWMSARPIRVFTENALMVTTSTAASVLPASRVMTATHVG